MAINLTTNSTKGGRDGQIIPCCGYCVFSVGTRLLRRGLSACTGKTCRLTSATTGKLSRSDGVWTLRTGLPTRYGNIKWRLIPVVVKTEDVVNDNNSFVEVNNSFQ